MPAKRKQRQISNSVTDLNINKCDCKVLHLFFFFCFKVLFCFTQEEDLRLTRKNQKRKERNSRFLNPRELFLNFRREKLLTDFWKTTKQEEDFLQSRSSDSDCKVLGFWLNNTLLFLGKGCGCFPGVGTRKRMNVKNVKQNEADAHDFQDGVYIKQTEL